MVSLLRQRDTDMTRGGILRLLLAFSVPLLIGNIFQQLYNTVDSVIVGNFVSLQALAAVGCTGPIINALIGLFAGLSSGAGVVISQYYGARDKEKLRQSVQTTVVLTLGLCVLLTAAGVLATPAMLRLMDTPADVFPEVEEYLRIYFWGACDAAALPARLRIQSGHSASDRQSPAAEQNMRHWYSLGAAAGRHRFFQYLCPVIYKPL